MSRINIVDWVLFCPCLAGLNLRPSPHHSLLICSISFNSYNSLSNGDYHTRFTDEEMEAPKQDNMSQGLELGRGASGTHTRPPALTLTVPLSLNTREGARTQCIAQPWGRHGRVPARSCS